MTEKEQIILLLREVKRDPEGVEKLIGFLEESDFFSAPASTKYHSNYFGGLVHHTLQVYKRLCDLIDMFKITKYSRESLILVALGHDFAKINFYEPCVNSKRVYHEKGTQKDILGRFDWVQEKGYRVKDFKDRYIFGIHGQNSERLLSQFIPLSDEESAAIIWHMGGMDGNKSEDLSDIYNQYSLASLLHAADYLSTYIDEKI
jgi:hypothetical protein